MTAEMPPDVAIEPIYVVDATYGPDAPELRPRFRAEHLTRIAELRDRGILIEAGGYSDFSSALLLLRAASEADALAIARDDVYLRAGVWVEFRVRPFGRVVRPAELPGG
jgi:uncharacterized protein YciI